MQGIWRLQPLFLRSVFGARYVRRHRKEGAPSKRHTSYAAPVASPRNPLTRRNKNTKQKAPAPTSAPGPSTLSRVQGPAGPAHCPSSLLFETIRGRRGFHSQAVN
jgi:hypothetical protein